jgi:uncharacterized protein (TIGR03067 family)
MKRFLTLSLVLLAVAGTSIATAIDVRAPRKIEASDLDRLRGQWAGPGDMIWEFQGDRYRIFSGGQLVADLRIKLRENKNPREFDVWYDGDDLNLQQQYPVANPYRGIYEFRGQQLVRCYAPPGSERPKAFDSTQGSLTTLERVPPAAKRAEGK